MPRHLATTLCASPQTVAINRTFRSTPDVLGNHCAIPCSCFESHDEGGRGEGGRQGVPRLVFADRLSGPAGLTSNLETTFIRGPIYYRDRRHIAKQLPLPAAVARKLAFAKIQGILLVCRLRSLFTGRPCFSPATSSFCLMRTTDADR